MRRPWPVRLLKALTLLACAWLFTLLLISSQTGAGVLALFFTVYGGVLLLGAFLLLLALSPRARAARLAYRVTTPACLLLAAALGVVLSPPSNPLFLLRFALSETALTTFAKQQLRTPERKPPAWIGLFPIDSVETFEGQVRFQAAASSIVADWSIRPGECRGVCVKTGSANCAKAGTTCIRAFDRGSDPDSLVSTAPLRPGD